MYENDLTVNTSYSITANKGANFDGWAASHSKWGHPYGSFHQPPRYQLIMAVTIDGDGTITGVSVGGLPDGIVDTDMLAADAPPQMQNKV